jgi:superfamily II DNA or RNA helicase
MSHKIRLDKVQDKAKKAILNHFKNKSKSCHVEMPTGTGKTNLGMKVLKSLEKTSKKSKRVLWLTQTEELIEQTVLDLSNKFKSKSVGLIQRDVFDINCDIIVASVQTLTKDKNLSKIPDNYFYLVIVDEAHHGGAVTWSKIINKFDSYLLGLTATAYRMDGTPLDSLFGKCVFKLSYQEAVDLKIIAEDDALVVFTSSLLNGVTFDGEDYAPHHLEKLVTSEERNKNIVKAYKKYGRKKMDSHGLRYKTVCFCVDIKHAVALNNYFNIEGIPSEILCSKSEYQSPKDREYV